MDVPGSAPSLGGIARRVEIAVSRRVDCAPAAVFALLADWRRYGEWWPLRVSPGPPAEGTMLIRPLPFVALAVRPEVLDPGRRLAYTYLAGPFRGRGVWTVAAEGALASRVTYEIALLPVNRLVALAASTPLFRAKHRRDIAAIIERLAAACGGAA